MSHQVIHSIIQHKNHQIMRIHNSRLDYCSCHLSVITFHFNTCIVHFNVSDVLSQHKPITSVLEPEFQDIWPSVPQEVINNSFFTTLLYCCVCYKVIYKWRLFFCILATHIKYINYDSVWLVFQAYNQLRVLTSSYILN